MGQTPERRGGRLWARGMSLFDGVDVVFYQVCSMDRAVEFYSGVLGLEVLRREGNDWTELRAGDTVIALSGELATRPHQGGATVILRAATSRRWSAGLPSTTSSAAGSRTWAGRRCSSSSTPTATRSSRSSPPSSQSASAGGRKAVGRRA